MAPPDLQDVSDHVDSLRFPNGSFIALVGRRRGKAWQGALRRRPESHARTGAPRGVAECPGFEWKVIEPRINPSRPPGDVVQCFTHRRIFLAGDALHGFPPFISHGTSMSWEDVGIWRSTYVHSLAAGLRVKARCPKTQLLMNLAWRVHRLTHFVDIGRTTHLAGGRSSARNRTTSYARRFSPSTTTTRTWWSGAT